LDSIKLETRLS